MDVRIEAEAVAQIEILPPFGEFVFGRFDLENDRLARRFEQFECRTKISSSRSASSQNRSSLKSFSLSARSLFSTAGNESSYRSMTFWNNSSLVAVILFAFNMLSSPCCHFVCSHRRFFALVVCCRFCTRCLPLYAYAGLLRSPSRAIQTSFSLLRRPSRFKDLLCAMRTLLFVAVMFILVAIADMRAQNIVFALTASITIQRLALHSADVFVPLCLFLLQLLSSAFQDILTSDPLLATAATLVFGACFAFNSFARRRCPLASLLAFVCLCIRLLVAVKIDHIPGFPP